MQPNEFRSEAEQSGDWDLTGFPTEPVTVRRTRSWAVALAAFLTGLAIIIAVGNPPVTRAINRQVSDAGNRFRDGVFQSLTSVQWRFGAMRGDIYRGWVGQLVADGVFLVLLFLLVWIVASARGGFWQAFFGTWACAVAAAMVAVYAGVAVLNRGALNRSALVPNTDAHSSKIHFVFFSQFSARPTTLFGALMFGFVIALIAGLVAVASRKKEVVVEAGPGGEPPPPSFFPPQQQGAGYPPAPRPAPSPSWSSGGEGDHPTEALPRTEHQGSQPTAVMPSVTDREDERDTTQMPTTGGQSSEPTGESSSETTSESSGETTSESTGESTGGDTEAGEDTGSPPHRDG